MEVYAGSGGFSSFFFPLSLSLSLFFLSFKKIIIFSFNISEGNLPLICPNVASKGRPVCGNSHLPDSNNAANGSPRGGEKTDILLAANPFQQRRNRFTTR